MIALGLPSIGMRVLATIAACLCLGMPAMAQEPAPTQWQVTKCRVYADALADARRDREGALSKPFLDGNEAFIARGCTERVPVCPRTEADLEIANILTIVAMNAGTASTFLPFACTDG